MLIYRTLSVLLFPFIEIYLFYRVYKKKEDKKRLRERFGNPSQSRPDGDLTWLHAVSVGETNSSLILVDELLKNSPKTTILFTTTTLTSAATVEAKIPEFNGKVIHQFLPIDSLFCVRDFLQFWRPIRAIFVESEIWPNLISEARAMGSEVFLVNARMSEKSAKRWSVARMIGFDIFENFNAIFAQSEEDKNRFSKLTKNEIFLYGNLKSQARDLSFNSDELTKLKSQIGTRKFWLAASTHKGEEEFVIQAHRELKKHFPDLLTILIPRHPNRAEEIKLLFGEINFAQRSQNQNIASSTEIYLADTLGELGTFYRLNNFAFLGGSLLPIGGHNPFEPIKLGCSVITGSHTFNFKEIYENLRQENACVIVDSKENLIKNLREFLDNPNIASALSSKASSIIANSENIVEKIVKKITKL
ncbi:MAG: 3-deoxy-D-manno-octulosonic acid transferase [Proteobacteria bacterium]|nr:3-deoxy-D-manno-octulosonic acid transferase [Pseudomonadota bacterium]